jgi:GT2 family glycosyltransferase
VNYNTLSIIILTWNSKDYIEKCLDSIYRFIKDISFEVIVVDNASIDGTIEILDEYKLKNKNLKCIFLNKNHGTTYPRNLAIKKANGDYVLFLDSDTELVMDIENLLNDFDKFENVGAVAPRLIYRNGTIQPNCKKFPVLHEKILKYLSGVFEKIGNSLELYNRYIYSVNFKNIIPVDYCISAGLLTKRDILEDVGLFDEAIFYAPEDVDLCLRMWLKGYKVLYDPNVKIIHYTQRISKRNLKIGISHFKGLIYYFFKHGYFFSRQSIYRRTKNSKIKKYEKR